MSTSGALVQQVETKTPFKMALPPHIKVSCENETDGFESLMSDETHFIDTPLPEASSWRLNEVPGIPCDEDTANDDLSFEMMRRRLTLETKYHVNASLVRRHPLFKSKFENETMFTNLYLLFVDLGCQEIRCADASESNGDMALFQIPCSVISPKRLPPSCYQFAWQLFLRFAAHDVEQKAQLLNEKTVLLYLAVTLHIAIVQLDSLPRYVECFAPVGLPSNKMANHTAAVCQEIFFRLSELRSLQTMSDPQTGVKRRISPPTPSSSTIFSGFANDVYAALHGSFFPTPTVLEWVFQFAHLIETNYRAFHSQHILLALDTGDNILMVMDYVHYPASIIALALLDSIARLCPDYTTEQRTMFQRFIQTDFLHWICTTESEWMGIVAITDAHVIDQSKQGHYQIPPPLVSSIMKVPEPVSPFSLGSPALARSPTLPSSPFSPRASPLRPAPGVSPLSIPTPLHHALPPPASVTSFVHPSGFAIKVSQNENNGRFNRALAGGMKTEDQLVHRVRSAAAATNAAIQSGPKVTCTKSNSTNVLCLQGAAILQRSNL